MHFGVILTSLAFGPISALQGRGCDVQSVHAGACFGRVRQIQQDSLLKQSLGTRTPKIDVKRPQENHKRIPSGTREPGWNTKSCPSPPQRTLKKREMETHYSRGKTSPRKEDVNKHMGKHEIAKFIFRTLRATQQSASKRTMVPQTAPWCPEALPEAEESGKNALEGRTRAPATWNPRETLMNKWRE